VLASGQAEVKVAPQLAAQVCELDFSDQITEENLRKLVFIAELWQGDQFISSSNSILRPDQALIPDRSGN
jgi:hypothetical protein